MPICLCKRSLRSSFSWARACVSCSSYINSIQTNTVSRICFARFFHSFSRRPSVSSGMTDCIGGVPTGFISIARSPHNLGCRGVTLLVQQAVLKDYLAAASAFGGAGSNGDESGGMCWWKGYDSQGRLMAVGSSGGGSMDDCGPIFVEHAYVL